MGEIGCIPDGNFQNLQVEGTMTSLSDLEITGKQTSNGVVHGFIKGSAAVPVTAAGNTDITLGTFPANCRIKNLMITFNSVVTTAAHAGDDLDFSLGIAGTTGQIIAPTAIADDAGGAVSLLQGVTYFICKDTLMAGTDALDVTGASAATGAPVGDPATNEAFSLVNEAAHIKNVDRVLVARLTPLANDLTATGTCTIVLEYISAFNV